MSKIIAGVFLGIFVSSLFYEIFSRQNPELAEQLKNKVKEKFDKCLNTEEALENSI